MIVTVAGKYRLVKKIGQGKFGYVFASVNHITKNTCAIKIEEAKIGLLKKEAKIYRLLKNTKGVLRLLDFGRDGKFNYLVMPLIQKPILRPTKTLVVKFIRQLFNTLEAIHKQEIIHCDLKPDNVVFTETGALILDFGLSRYGPPKSSQLKAVIGSLAYCSARVSNLHPPEMHDDIISLTLCVAFYTGVYLPPYSRNELPDTFKDLLTHIPTLGIKDSYTYPLSVLTRILEKQG